MRLVDQIAFLDALNKLNMPQTLRCVKDNFGTVMTWADFKRAFPLVQDMPEWTLGVKAPNGGRFVSVLEMVATLKAAPGAEYGLFKVYADIFPDGSVGVNALRDLLFASDVVNAAIAAAVESVLGKYRGV